MARRVKQADGTYCYTDNCRIHDRSGDSTGLQAVLNDAKLHQIGNFNYKTSDNIQEQLGINGHKADTMSQKVVEAVLHGTSGDHAYEIAEALKESAREEGLDPEKLDILPAAYAIQRDMLEQSIIRQGDEVILNETGERGTIVEGNSFFGQAVRFKPESSSSRNGFAWFQPDAVSKVSYNYSSLMREKIMASSPDVQIPGHYIKKLLEEETSPTTRNAQGTKEFGKHAKEAREHIQAIGDEIVKEVKWGHLTKDNVIATLKRHYDKEMAADVPVEVVKATKSGLRNIITYLNPNGDHHS